MQMNLSADIIRKIVDDQRPEMSLVVESLSEALAASGSDIVQTMQGPDLWSWEDSTGRVYAVAPSPTHNGHPMLTIRQPVATTMGAWITTCCLVLGHTKADILNSLTVTVVTHIGSFVGHQATVKKIAKSGNPLEVILDITKVTTDIFDVPKDWDPDVN